MENYAYKLERLAKMNLFAKADDYVKEEKETVYVFGPAGMIVLA